MRILLMHYHELDELGGVEVLIRRFAEGFTQRKHPTAVIEMGRQFRLRPEWLPGVPLWTLTASTFPSLKRPRSLASYGRTLMQFQRVVREFDPDIVHVHFPGGQSLPVVGAHVLPHRWRLAVTVHNSDIRVAAANDARVRTWQGRLLRRAGAVTAVSQALLDDALAMHPHIGGKRRVIYNGIAPFWFEHPTPVSKPDERYVLFVGRLHRMKGIDVLLRAWAKLQEPREGLKLWIVGDGPEKEDLQRATNELGIEDSVRFFAARKNADLPALYAQAEMLVMPSRTEGLGIVLLEASASGAICVGTRVPGISEVIEDGRTGFLVPSESSEALAEAVHRVLVMPKSEKQKLRDKARKAVERRFSEEAMFASYLGLYQTLLSDTETDIGNQRSEYR